MREDPKTRDGISPRWADALLAARVLAANGANIGGLRLRSGAGPVRDAWLRVMQSLAMPDAPWVRVPASVSPDALTGGIDIAATLHAGRPVSGTGLLARAHCGYALVAMAERTERAVAGIMAQAMDAGTCMTREGGTRPARFTLIALDEGEDGDEALPPALADRLGMTLDLNGVSVREAPQPSPGTVLPGRGEIAAVEIPDGIAGALAELSLHFPGGSLRKLVALNALVRTIASLDEAHVATERHAAAAIRLCTGVTLGETAQDEEPQTAADSPPPQDGRHEDQQPDGADDKSDGDGDGGSIDNAAEMLVAVQAAARAAILKLDRADLGKAGAAAKAGKAGARKSGSKRGRPCGLVLAPPYVEARPDVAATLRAAIPWQRLRGRAPDAPLKVLPSDFRYIRFRHRTESTAIFAVDASGSTALARLAEAKGAVELLLADCYVRRDNVALIAFRGTEAETLLEPTRSLVRAKRSLTGLPGGGPTPLAKGIMRSLELAMAVRRRGQSPLIVYLTDGNGNIALDGKADRARAHTEANTLARQGAALNCPSIVIDIGNRPRETARALAAAMNADYCPLPHATAASVSTIVGRYLKAG